MKKVVSAGVVVYRVNKNGEREYLLLRHAGGQKHWSFPKGKREGHERLLETAQRELSEETGLKAELVEDFRTRITYDSIDSREGACRKTVYYFLGKAVGVCVQLSDEHSDYVWLSYEKARTRLTYESSKRVLDKVYAAGSGN